MASTGQHINRAFLATNPPPNSSRVPAVSGGSQPDSELLESRLSLSLSSESSFSTHSHGSPDYDSDLGQALQYLPFDILSQESHSSISSSTSEASTLAGDELDPPMTELQVVTHTQLSAEVKAQVQALRHIALWPYRKIAESINLPLTTVFRAAQQSPSSTPLSTTRSATRGRHPILSPEIRRKLMDVATTSAETRRKSFTEIAYLAGIHACEKTLRQAFALEGYHRRVARKKPFLTLKHINVIYFLSVLAIYYFFIL